MLRDMRVEIDDCNFTLLALETTEHGQSVCMLEAWNHLLTAVPDIRALFVKGDRKLFGGVRRMAMLILRSPSLEDMEYQRLVDVKPHFQ